MDELIFIVKKSFDGGYEARALGESIFTQGETYDEVKSNIIEAVECHFDDNKKRIVRIQKI